MNTGNPDISQAFSPPARGAADGRFAPSPTGELHVGNLRTALLAWLFARSERGRFLVRIDDLDPDRTVKGMAACQLDDLAALGLDWDEPPVLQSQRFDLYRDAIAELQSNDLLYRCYCTRAEIRDAASAPHAVASEGLYAGTCRILTRKQIAERERRGSGHCLRLNAESRAVSFQDRLLGPVEQRVDDFVVVRKDGVPAYNVAVVVDDAAQGVGQVVRGADLASGTPRQVLLGSMLGLPVPSYAHVPLMMGPDGTRLAKRHGSVSLSEWSHRVQGGPVGVRSWLAASAGLCDVGESPSLDQLIARFEPGHIPAAPTVLDADLLMAPAPTTYDMNS